MTNIFPRISCRMNNRVSKKTRVGVFDVGEKFHLVLKMLLLLRGYNLTLGLLPNGFIQEQSYRRAKSFTDGSLANRDEMVLWSVPNIRFRRVNKFKWDMLYRRHQVYMRIATIWHWKYKRGLPVRSMQSGKLRQDNDPRPR
jgi:hypothetical protein